MADLKPCPFCGENDPEIEHIEGTILHPAYFVKCGPCGAQAPWSDKGDHVDMWNCRAPDTRLAAQLRECAETLGADQIDEQRAMRAYADAVKLLDELKEK